MLCAKYVVVIMINNMEFVHSRLLMLLTLLICLMKLSVGLGTDIYIQPSPHSPCPVEQCLTLSQLGAKSVLDSFSDNQNTTLIFLPGNYTLKSNISITNVSNFSIVSRTSDVSIFCHQNVSLEFEGIKSLAVTMLFLMLT